MNLTTLNILNELIDVNHDQLMATKLHLEHQIQLPAEHRVMEMDEEEAEKQLVFIKTHINKLENARADINTKKDLNLSA